jgi:hypothetical protein
VSQPPDLRVSDADRERIAERLRDAAGEGRLTVEELDERLELVYGARVGSELAAVTADLPQASPASQSPDRRGRRRWLISVLGGRRLRGRWLAGRKITSIGFMGGADIDLRDAVLTEGELTITTLAVMGGVNVIVPPGVDVTVSGFALMGGHDSNIPPQDLPPGARRVHVRAYALMGGVSVRMRSRDRKALEAATEPPSTDA